MSRGQANISDPVIAVNIPLTYENRITSGDVYDCTRGIWRLSVRRAGNAHYAFAVYRGVIKEVFEIDQWLPAGATKYQERQFSLDELKGRYEFVGKVAPNEIQDRYVDRELPVLHEQNPVRYFNC